MNSKEVHEELQDSRIAELERRVEVLTESLKTTIKVFEQQQQFNNLVKDTITGGK
jgi:hypothetical protein